MGQIKPYAEKGDWTTVQRMTDKYLFLNDSDLQQIRNEAEIKFLATEVEKIPESQIVAKLDAYRRLAQLLPNEFLYEAKVKGYEARLKEISFPSKIKGWVKSETCWVVSKPRTDSPIIGIIKKKAAVTVIDVGDGWGKIDFAPVIDPLTGKFINECKDCYIQLKNITTVLGDW